MPILKSKKARSGAILGRVSDIYPLHNVLSATSGMSGAAGKVARYIIENPEHAALMSIGELAAATGSNKTAIVRVSKKCGYNGYRGLRAALLENRGVLRGSALIGVDLPFGKEGMGSLTKLARDVVKINIEVLQDTLVLLDEETLLRAVNAIQRAKHVFLVGFGTSAPVIQDAYQRFLRLRVPSSTCSDAHILASIVSSIGPDELLFCISYSGMSRDVIEALEAAKSRGTPTITLTSVPKSVAAEISDMVIVSAVRRTPHATESVASRVAQLVVVDIICAIIALGKENELNELTERFANELSKKRI